MSNKPLVVWKCSCCGCDTHMHPPTEPVLEEKEIEQEVLVEKDELVDDPQNPEQKIILRRQVPEKVTTRAMVPKMTRMKRQNQFTGEMEEVEVPAQRDLFPRTTMVQLKIGQEVCQKNFCPDCWSDFRRKALRLWIEMESL